MKSKRALLLIVIFIAMLLAIPNAKATSLPAPPPEMLKIDSAVVIQKQDAAFRRAARERKRVVTLMREAVEYRKFQFEAQYVRYRTIYEQSNFTIQCYGGRIFCGDSTKKRIDQNDQDDFQRNQNNRIPQLQSQNTPQLDPSNQTQLTLYDSLTMGGLKLRSVKRNKLLKSQDKLSYNVTSTNFKIDNFREEISNVLTFDVIINTIANLHGRDYFEQKLICSFNIYDGRMAVKVLYFNEKSQEYDTGAEYYGWLVTLR